MIENIEVRAFSSNKLQLFSYTILENYPFFPYKGVMKHHSSIFNIFNLSKIVSFLSLVFVCITNAEENSFSFFVCACYRIVLHITLVKKRAVFLAS